MRRCRIWIVVFLGITSAMTMMYYISKVADVNDYFQVKMTYVNNEVVQIHYRKTTVKQPPNHRTTLAAPSNVVSHKTPHLSTQDTKYTRQVNPNTPKTPAINQASTKVKVIRKSYPKGVPLNCITRIQLLIFNDTLLIPNDELLSELNIEDIRCIYHRYIRTTQYLCTYKELLGGVGEGGYTICNDLRYNQAPPCTVLIATDVMSGEAFRRFNRQKRCNIHLFNQRGVNTTGKHQGLTVHHIHKIGLKEKFKSLDVIYNETFPKEQGESDILILDIFSDYLPLMTKHLSEGFFKRFRQLVFRPRFPFHNSIPDCMKYLNILRRLYEEGFRIHHLENNLNVHLRKDVKGAVLSFININYKDYANRNIYENATSLPDIGTLIIKDKNPGDYYFDYLRSPQVLCKTMLRTGKADDGGWEVCYDEKYRPIKPCLVYSVGINFDYSFDDEISSKHGCEVHSFDPSMRGVKEHKRTSLVTFHNIGLGDTNRKTNKGWTLKTFRSIRERLGHQNRTIDVLKMDIEWSEIKVIPEMIRSGQLDSVRQFVFEIHTRKRKDSDIQYRTELSLLKALYNYGFRIFFSHNNLYGTYIAGDSLTKRTFAYEIHMLNMRNVTNIK